MRLAILADIHSNLEALEAVLDLCAREQVAGFLNLGDTVGYGADPEACVRRIRSLPCRGVAGNHDWAAAERLVPDGFNPAAYQAILWTREQLSQESLRFLSGLRLTRTLRSPSARLAHGSPSDPGAWKYLRPQDDLRAEFDRFSERICLVGHSHIPFAVRQSDSEAGPQRIQEQEFELSDDASRYLVNPGSIGQPRDGDPRASFMTFDAGLRRLRFRRVEYNIAAAQQKIIAAGLPESLAERLTQGR